MLLNERNTRSERLMAVANAMMTAARTAPKGKGFDIIEIVTLTGEDIIQLSEAMRVYSDKTGLMFVLRDAENIL
nr:ferredoxin [Paludibacter sp.]